MSIAVTMHVLQTSGTHILVEYCTIRCTCVCYSKRTNQVHNTWLKNKFASSCETVNLITQSSRVRVRPFCLLLVKLHIVHTFEIFFFNPYEIGKKITNCIVIARCFVVLNTMHILLLVNKQSVKMQFLFNIFIFQCLCRFAYLIFLFSIVQLLKII